MEAGGYEVRTVVTSRFALDGGAMFGSVPKSVWSRKTAVDEANRIPLVSRTLVLRGRGRIVLVDTGIGRRFDDKGLRLFAIDPGVEIVRALRAAGIAPEEVTDVFLTHLHFDHAGGLFGGSRDQPVPNFPRAKIYIQRANWERAHAPGPKERASYRPEEIRALEESDLVLLEGESEPLPGIRVQAGDGHTRGHQVVWVGEGREAILYTGDLVPTVSHLHLAYTMGYDMCAERLLAEKEACLEACRRQGAVLVLDHDPGVPGGRLGRNEKGFFVQERMDL
jgi:glyoxylase-like metal-dependent hydrolase (beta-lactamase superfamily II)